MRNRRQQRHQRLPILIDFPQHQLKTVSVTARLRYMILAVVLFALHAFQMVQVAVVLADAARVTVVTDVLFLVQAVL